MPELTVDFDVVCAVCGEPLRATTAINNYVRADPCPKCLSSSREDGFKDGHAKGYQEGYDAGVDGRNP